ncbi:replication initiation factor domain-containing protein [Lactococcus lactis]|nr:replication initiation factor domain-containing protein [Lactococcus lactis]
MRLKVSFDWVSLHFRTTDVDNVVRHILKLKLSEFSLEDYARYQYSQLYRYGAINLYVDSKDETHGVLIECSGTACRELETILEAQERDWYDLFNDCLVYEKDLRLRSVTPLIEGEEATDSLSYFNVTRLDLALDEFYSEKGNYKLLNLFEHFHDGLVGTTKRRYSSQMGGQYTSEGLINDGLTLYLGSPQSSPFFRFYEKDAERAKALSLSLDSVHDLYGYKNRYEIVLRGDKAHKFIQGYVSEYFDVAKRAVDIINANLVVFSDFHGHLDEEWYDLMNSKEAYRFETNPKEVDVNRTWVWAEKNVLPTMAFLKKDDPEKFQELLEHSKIPKRYQHYLERKQTHEKQNP